MIYQNKEVLELWSTGVMECWNNKELGYPLNICWQFVTIAWRYKLALISAKQFIAELFCYKSFCYKIFFLVSQN